MIIDWNAEKNEWLKNNRFISFEQVLEEIEHGRFIGPEENPSREGQKRIIVKINEYSYVVPFVIDNNGNWFLKTAYPSRKQKGRL